jgi:hypothetical protein
LKGDQRSSKLKPGGGVSRNSQHSKFVLHACLTKWKDILPKLWLSSLLLLRGWTETESKPFKSGSGRRAEGPVCKMGAQLINCTGVCGAAAGKPRSCGSKQPYGGVVDRVWRLGLQAKAKAATMALRWRVPEIQIIFQV